jgi:CRP-like cAMP-binding protein
MPSAVVRSNEYAGKLHAVRSVAAKPVRNTILLRLPESEFSRIKPQLEAVKFQVADLLERQSLPVNGVYFLNSGIASFLIETSDARSVEIGLSGREHVIGLVPLLGGLERLTYNVVIQVPGEGFRAPAKMMRELLPGLPQMRELLLRRMAIRCLEQAQNAACNCLHSVKERLARWMLLVHDRVDTDVIATTHDFVSKMVGADRTTVSLAMRDLERRGVLLRKRGAIRITDRDGLEEQSCECYAVFNSFNAELGLRRKINLVRSFTRRSG